jgi:RNA-directed DNA polymerase
MTYTLKRQTLRNNEYYDTQEMFDRLYAQSQNNENFKRLYELIIDERNIRLAYRNIKRNQGALTAGTDDATISDVAEKKDNEIVNRIRERLEDYKPNKIRRVEIPKPDGSKRPLGIATIEDRLIQQCIKQVLEPIVEAKFHRHSYGFRPNRSVSHAMARVMQLININKLHYVVDIDIKSFFDNVNHAKLKKQLWSMGIRDKRLLSILHKMLTTEVDGYGILNKGLPQGGILSPLLANIVLNEFDWWVSSQWETFKSNHNYDLVRVKNGHEYTDKSGMYRALRASNLKEIFIVRYADDFKIFCRSYKDAKSIYEASKQWLSERLKFEVNESKSGITNLKRNSTEFLGFRIKAVPNKGKYTARTSMSETSKKNAIAKLTDQLACIKKNPRSTEVFKLNAIILGLQNYYNRATMVSKDFADIAFIVERRLHNRFKKVITTTGTTPKNFQKLYPNWKTYKPIFLYGVRVFIISDVKMDIPIKFQQTISNYSRAGRNQIHQELKVADRNVLEYLIANPIQNQSIEYNDNRISKYIAQKGKCAVTGLPLTIGQMDCHHKQPKFLGGTDEYKNLIFILKDVHKLIHATDEKTVTKYIRKLKLDEQSKRKINELRRLVNNQIIE